MAIRGQLKGSFMEPRRQSGDHHMFSSTAGIGQAFPENHRRQWALNSQSLSSTDRSLPALTQELRHGFRTSTPVGSKSATLRVTTVMPCTSAVAAMRPSRTGRGSGTWRRALRCATAVSTDRIRPAKAGKTCAFSHVRNMAPCDGSRRSASNTPISSSWMLIAQIGGFHAVGPICHVRVRFTQTDLAQLGHDMGIEQVHQDKSAVCARSRNGARRVRNADARVGDPLILGKPWGFASCQPALPQSTRRC